MVSIRYANGRRERERERERMGILLLSVFAIILYLSSKMQYLERII
jgi:hypothetical protein